MAKPDQQQTYTSDQHFCSSCGRVQDDLQKQCCDPCRNSSHREARQVTSTEENEPHTLLAFVLCQMECAGLCDTPRDVQPCWEQRVWADKPRQHALPCLCAVVRWLHGFQMRTGWCPAAGEHGQSKITPVGMHLCALPSQNTGTLKDTFSQMSESATQLQLSSSVRQYCLGMPQKMELGYLSQPQKYLGQVKSKKKIYFSNDKGLA